jgi:acyl-CoA thioesterase FadM
LKYDDFFEVKMQAKVSGAKIIFQYKIFVESNLVCLAETTHCNLSSDLKVKRLDPHLKQIIERELWTETWL